MSLESLIHQWNGREPSDLGFLSPRFRYLDPHASSPVEGSGLVAFFLRFRAALPGFQIELVGQPKAHHGATLQPWVLKRPDGSVFSSGQFVALYDADGLLERLVSFVDG
jgi:hypothetical protein